MLNHVLKATEIVIQLCASESDANVDNVRIIFLSQLRIFCVSVSVCLSVNRMTQKVNEF